MPVPMRSSITHTLLVGLVLAVLVACSAQLVAAPYSPTTWWYTPLPTIFVGYDVSVPGLFRNPQNVPEPGVFHYNSTSGQWVKMLYARDFAVNGLPPRTVSCTLNSGTWSTGWRIAGVDVDADGDTDLYLSHPSGSHYWVRDGNRPDPPFPLFPVC